jgi:hypothetical protein
MSASHGSLRASEAIQAMFMDCIVGGASSQYGPYSLIPSRASFASGLA